MGYFILSHPVYPTLGDCSVLSPIEQPPALKPISACDSRSPLRYRSHPIFGSLRTVFRSCALPVRLVQAGRRVG